MPNIELMNDFSEIVQYEHPPIPLDIRTASLSVYPGMSAPCHWHDDIEWIHILFHPSLFCSNQALQRQYVAPVLRNNSLEYLHFSSSQSPGPEVSGFLTRIVALKERAAPGYEMEAIALMHMLWIRLWQAGKLISDPDHTEMSNDLSYFSKYFCHCFGCSPREYRKREKIH